MGRYDLLLPLGEGGMGEVFAARLRGESGFERLFAIKRVKPEWASDQQFVKRFFDEARTAASIHSAFVVPVLDVGRDENGVPFMVQGLVVGVTLWELIEAESPSCAMALALMLDAVRGLRDAHATVDQYGQPLRIAHRDVSTRNILVGVDGRARLTDFGLAKASRRDAVTAPGEILGSYAYFSPEHLSGTADAQSDVFSLGIVAWETFTRRRLFTQHKAATLLRALTTEPIPDVREIEPAVPADVARAIMRALKRDRDQRWRRADDFLRALESCALEPAPPDTIATGVQELAAPFVTQLRALVDDTLVEFPSSMLTRHVVAGRGFDDADPTLIDSELEPEPDP